MYFVKVVERKVKYKGYTGKFYIDEVPPEPNMRFYNFIVGKHKKKLCHKILDKTMNIDELKKATKEFVERWEEYEQNVSGYNYMEYISDIYH